MTEEGKQKEKPLEHILAEMGLISQEQLSRALDLSQEQGISVKDAVVALDFTTERQILAALTERFGLREVDLANYPEIPPELITLVSRSVAENYKIMPLAEENGELLVAMADPFNINALEDLKFLLDRPVRGAIADAEQVQGLFEKYYADEPESVERLLEEIETESKGMELPETTTETIDLESIEEMAEAAPVRRLLNLVLLQAIKDRASDIHFEPFEDEFKIR